MTATASVAFRILVEREVCEITKRSRTAIWRDVKAGTFPAPVRIGPRRKGWKSDDVQRWLDSLTEADLSFGAASAKHGGAGRNLVNAPAVDQVAAEVGREEARRGAPMELAEVLP